EDATAAETEEITHEAAVLEQAGEEDTADTEDTMPAASTNSEGDTTDHDTAEEQTTHESEEPHTEATILHAEERFNDEIEELLSLLGLSQSMIKTTNEMIVPPV